MIILSTFVMNAMLTSFS